METQHEVNREILEKLLDGCRLDTLIYTLSEICFRKADYLDSNWQDPEKARAWDKAGKYLDRVSQTVAIQKVSR